jgi:hypothetical protein
MIENSVENLIFVGDAYANLPIGDNFGLSEDMHMSVPNNYMLGVYGETKFRAELFVRKSIGQKLNNGI